MLQYLIKIITKIGCLIYVHDFFKDLGKLCKPLYNKLKKNLVPWTEEHSKIIIEIKKKNL